MVAEQNLRQNVIIGIRTIFLGVVTCISVQRIIRDFIPKEYRFLNRGISGHKLEDLKGRWEVDVLKESPDVLSVLIGTNDIDQFMRERKLLIFERWGTITRR